MPWRHIAMCRINCTLAIARDRSEPSSSSEVSSLASAAMASRFSSWSIDKASTSAEIAALRSRSRTDANTVAALPMTLALLLHHAIHHSVRVDHEIAAGDGCCQPRDLRRIGDSRSARFSQLLGLLGDGHLRSRRLPFGRGSALDAGGSVYRRACYAVDLHRDFLHPRYRTRSTG